MLCAVGMMFLLQPGSVLNKFDVNINLLTDAAQKDGHIVNGQYTQIRQTKKICSFSMSFCVIFWGDV